MTLPVHPQVPPVGNARRVLAENLRALRAERGWSQEDLALEAGLHRTFVAHVERRTRNISLDNIEKLAIALNVTPARLLTDGGPQPSSPVSPLSRQKP